MPKLSGNLQEEHWPQRLQQQDRNAPFVEQRDAVWVFTRVWGRGSAGTHLDQGKPERKGIYQQVYQLVHDPCGIGLLQLCLWFKMSEN